MLCFTVFREYIYDISLMEVHEVQPPAQLFEQSTALYQRYASAVFAYLLRHLGSREDAEDMLLEVFLAVLEKEMVLRLDEQQLRAFVWAIARHKITDHYRRTKQHRSVSLTVVEELIYENDARAPEQIVLYREEEAELHSTLRELPEQQREILHLRFGHELSCAEIAQVTSKSEGAVRMQLHRSLKLLRRLYHKKEAERNV
jgi:RNA polymerase sigma-70 factor, ECF subfamily